MLGIVMSAALLLWTAAVYADDYSDTLTLFKNAKESGQMLKTAYGYAVFPTIGKGGLGIGGAYSKEPRLREGRLQGRYQHDPGEHRLPAGGQGYSQLVLFENKASFDEFTSGNFEFSAGASAVAIKSAAGASAGTSGASAGASRGSDDATTTGKYYKGMAVYTIVKGGAMYEATVAGQKFSYKPKA
jgi:hypothetical protein